MTRPTQKENVRGPTSEERRGDSIQTSGDVAGQSTHSRHLQTNPKRSEITPRRQGWLEEGTSRNNCACVFDDLFLIHSRKDLSLRSRKCWKREDIPPAWMRSRQRRMLRRGVCRRRTLAIPETLSLVWSGTSSWEKYSALGNCSRLNSDMSSSLRGRAMCNQRTNPPISLAGLRTADDFVDEAALYQNTDDQSPFPQFH